MLSSANPLADDLRLAISAARKAGAVALSYFGGPLDIRDKSPNNPVTDADLAVNATLEQEIRANRPNDGWLSEETADDKSRLNTPRFWVIDPIDGTRAFIKGRPHFTIAIGLISENSTALGVVYNPVHDELFVGIAGHGAFLNDEPIRASHARTLSNCRMLGDAHMFAHPSWPESWPHMDVDQRNSIAYRLCLLASGEFDAAIALSAKHDWDLAAACLILEEAGGKASAHDGRPFDWRKREPRQTSLVASGPYLHDELLRRVSHIRLK